MDAESRIVPHAARCRQRASCLNVGGSEVLFGIIMCCNCVWPTLREQYTHTVHTHSHSHTLTFTPTGHLERAVSLTPGRGGEPQEHREIEQTPHGSAQNGTLDLVAAPQYKHETSRDVRSNRAADIAEATCGE